jgi:YVTN family beta-propeller protein
VDAVADKPVVSVAIGDGQTKPDGLALSSDGKRVYVAEGRGAAVSVIDVASRKVVARIPVGERPWGIALSTSGDRLYTANGNSNDVSVVDTAQGKTIARIPVGKKPYGILYVRSP